MIVVLDSNVLVADYFLTRPEWRVLSTSSQWGVRVVVPAAVIIEVDAQYRRDLGELAWPASGELGKLKVDAADVAAAWLAAVRTAAESYRPQLEQNTHAHGFEIADPPTVDHLTLSPRRQQSATLQTGHR